MIILHTIEGRKATIANRLLPRSGKRVADLYSRCLGELLKLRGMEAYHE